MITATKTELTLTQIDKMFDVAEIIKTDDEVYVSYDCKEFYINASLNIKSDESYVEIWLEGEDDNSYKLNDEQYNYIINKLKKFNKENI